MLQIKQYRSAIFGSNTYTITSPKSNGEVFLVDCGSYEEILNDFKEPFRVKGIFITHYHYDHIFSINKWIQRFPDILIYGSDITKTGLNSPKKNLSFYHDNPVSAETENYKVLVNGEDIVLWDDLKIKSITTEGHCEGSISLLCNEFIFTGDALIPNVPIVTKLKTGSKLVAKLSVEKIRSACSPKTMICPGHLEITPYNNVAWESYRNFFK